LRASICRGFSYVITSYVLVVQVCIAAAYGDECILPTQKRRRAFNSISHGACYQLQCTVEAPSLRVSDAIDVTTQHQCTITNLDSVLLDREIQSVLGVVLSTQCRPLLLSAIFEDCDVALIIESLNNINVSNLNRYYTQHPKNTPQPLQL